MKNENFIIINGQKYDSVSGKPIIDASRPKTTQQVSPIARKSQLMHRNLVRKTPTTTLTRKPGRNMDMTRSNSITRFKHKDIKKAAIAPDTAPTTHPIVSTGEKKQTLIRNHLSHQQKQITKKTPQAIKNDAITAALEQPTIKHVEKPFYKRHAKLILSSILILAICTASYLVYTSIPSFSVKIASAQAGINATFPGYFPDGYSPNGPVTSNNSQVLINFKSNSDSTYFNIRQTRSTWDSTAVKDMVTKKSNNTFSTTEERGLTIYIYNGNAAWVNGGILYEIIGNAPLSSYQVRKMATSL